jgi:hypothetical protein
VLTAKLLTLSSICDRKARSWLAKSLSWRPFSSEVANFGGFGVANFACEPHIAVFVDVDPWFFFCGLSSAPEMRHNQTININSGFLPISGFRLMYSEKAFGDYSNQCIWLHHELMMRLSYGCAGSVLNM